MSWFNETFSDSLNSIKGQITKITKEVLAEDENEKDEDAESIRSQLKELDALCQSKDLEIASLREENKKISHRFQEELKLLRNENNKLKNGTKGKNENVLLGDDQIQQICELENELYQLKIERDHLEELQKDHQSDICLVMQQRDSSKSELEKLKADYSDLKSKYVELENQQNNSQVTSTLTDVNLLEIQNKDDELANLRQTIEILQSQIDLHHKEKEDTIKLNDSLKFEDNSSKEIIEKLMEDIKKINAEKDNIDMENCRLKETLHFMRNELNKKSDEYESEQRKQYELEEKLKNVTESLENSKLEHSNLKQELENQVKKLFNIFLIKNTENKSLSSSINDIENVWKKSLQEKENAEKIHNENINKFQSEIQRLKNDKISLEHEIKIGIENRNELECDYRKEINSLQNKYLQLKSQEQDCLIKSQTDDVKRLDQEVTKLMEIVDVKNNELGECYNKMNTVNQELDAIKELAVNLEQELLKMTAQRDEKEKKLLDLKSYLEKREQDITAILVNMEEIKIKSNTLEDEKNNLSQQSVLLQSKLNETVKINEELEMQIQSLKSANSITAILQQELEEIANSKSELEKVLADFQQKKLNSENQSEYIKAQLIIKESAIAELSAKNQSLSEEIIKLKSEFLRLQSTEEELNKWKEAMVELEIQKQELLEQKDLLEKECSSLSLRLTNEKLKDDELEDIKRENSNLIEICNKLRNEAQSKIQSDEIKKEPDSEGRNLELLSSLQIEIENLRVFSEQQGNTIASLTYENNQLKHHIQLMNESLAALSEENNQLKQTRSIEPAAEDRNIINVQSQMSKDKLNVVQQHKRSKSDFDTASLEENVNKLRLELEMLRESSQRLQKEYEASQEQQALLSEKEAHSRKELERLRLHLIEVENYYTETIDEYKTKLNVTEEQLKNSSTVYTSTKVRDNQHLESLQSQIRLISAQRDDLQMKLSSAEDEVQKHKAALTSFHVVLEQFQQDREREIEGLAAKYDNQLKLSDRGLAELQQEINSLNNQLNDAKNGLKAASRLGEQLERKSEQIKELEHILAETKSEMNELKERTDLVNQSNFGKVDKSLVKNLLLGYISAHKGDRKNQVLRILMSVLDFDEEERNKIGGDNTQSGWLSHLLHPRGDGTQSSQSLSEAFIRFLENESRPQPQLKLLPERSHQVDKTNPSGSKVQRSLLLQELVLPTFNSQQTRESTILKDVLNDT